MEPLKKRWLLIAAIGLAAAILGTCFWKNHIRICGRFYPRNSVSLDLRALPLTWEDYRHLREELPKCQILWQTPLSAGSVPSDAREITVSSLTRGDLERMDCLTELERVDAWDCPDEENLLALCRERKSLTVSYRVAVGDRLVDHLAEEITVDAGEISVLTEKLEHFPKLAAVTAAEPLPNAGELTAFREANPGIRLSWSVELGGRLVSCFTRELDLSGTAVSREELERAISYLPELKRLELHGCGLTQEELRGIARNHPETDVLFDITVASLTVPTDIRELDLSGIPMESVREVEEALPCFTNLERVVMCDTGISNEEMDELGKRHPETRFVWTVTISGIRLRTDATYYSRSNYEARTQDLDDLGYCVDLEAVDLGHMKRLDSCEWVANMPKLKYLILADTSVSDLTPLSNLKSLVFLEIFDTPVEDYSPLVSCTGLEDLNLGSTYGDPEPLTRMPWLKHLWWSGLKSRSDTPGYRALELLPKALPDTEIQFEGSHPTSRGWRKIPNYFKMRDALHAEYME